MGYSMSKRSQTQLRHAGGIGTYVAKILGILCVLRQKKRVLSDVSGTVRKIGFDNKATCPVHDEVFPVSS